MRIDGPQYKLHVSIDLDAGDGKRISVRDNAAGIGEKDYDRAFRPAEVPPDTSGLSEFGMGMKSAACWFAPRWSVRTKAIGESFEKIVRFDIATIVRDELEELNVSRRPARTEAHYTELVLEDVYHPLQTKTITKVREHLASIYRVFLRQGILELRFDNQALAYSEPAILRAPYWKTPGTESRLWRKDIQFDLGQGMRVHGFAALRETGSTSKAGFALFRRDRLIVGSGDEGYRPELIFGKSNSFSFQRLFGELHLEGFEVSHTKDGFRWDENEGPFLELLKEHLNSQPLPLLEQAEGYRVRPSREEVTAGAELAARRTAAVIEKDVPPVLAELEGTTVSTDPPVALRKAVAITQRTIDVELKGVPWQIVIELSNDPAISDWLELCDQPAPDAKREKNAVRKVGVRLSLAHPFMERFGGTTVDEIEPLLRLAAALALAETAARDAGVKMVSTIRRNVNELLRDALSKP
jgi:hypothetical protein